jgi:hypothetical protein
MSRIIIVSKEVSSVNTACMHSVIMAESKKPQLPANENPIYLHTEFSNGGLVTTIKLKPKSKFYN